MSFVCFHLLYPTVWVDFVSLGVFTNPLSHGVLRACVGSPEKDELLTNISDFLGLLPLPPYSGARSGERHGVIPSPESHPVIGWTEKRKRKKKKQNTRQETRQKKRQNTNKGLLRYGPEWLVDLLRDMVRKHMCVTKKKGHTHTQKILSLMGFAVKRVLPNCFYWQKLKLHKEGAESKRALVCT